MTVTLPDGFLWGVAAAAHQIEGGNWNNDWWAFEHKPDTPCVEPSGDCTDSFHRYADDIALVRDLGFGAYRFSIEWSRIEPEDGEFSIAALDYYRRVLADVPRAGRAPVVTFHHFTTPRWVADRGGWDEPEIVDRFARFCERTVAHLGDLIAIGCTINEPNIVSLIGYVVGRFPPGRARLRRSTRRPPRTSATRTARVRRDQGGPGRLPRRACVSMGDWWTPEGGEDGLRPARGDARGLLPRSRARQRLRRRPGVLAHAHRPRRAADGPEPGVEIVESMGYEYWPQALEVAIRYAAESPATRCT